MNDQVKKSFLELFPEGHEVDNEMVANSSAVTAEEIVGLADIVSAEGIGGAIKRSGTGVRISVFEE